MPEQISKAPPAGRIVDLTLPITPGMTRFPAPWHPEVRLTQLGTLGKEGRRTHEIVMGTHSGTHCDAPSHFMPKGGALETLPLEVLLGPALVLDFSGAAPGQAIEVDDLERRIGAREAVRLILRFDWSRHFNLEDYYLNHPYLTLSAARWLVERRVTLLAMDTPTPDAPLAAPEQGGDSPVHKILLANGVVLIEYLGNLDQLASPEVFLIALPLNIPGVDGSPARVVAIEGWRNNAGH